MKCAMEGWRVRACHSACRAIKARDVLIGVINCIPEGVCRCNRAEERLVIDGGTPVYYSLGEP